MNLRALAASLTEEEKQELLNIISQTCDNNIQKEINTEKQNEEQVSQSVDTDFTMNKNTKQSTHKKREKVRASNNIWKDEGEDRHIITPDINLTPRNRKPPQIIDIKCHICSKNYKINKALLYGEFYRCDRCSGNY